MISKILIYFIFYGGGLWLWLLFLWEWMIKLEMFLVDMVVFWLEFLKVILMVLGYWEEVGMIGVMFLVSLLMEYDYYGFFKEMYEISYFVSGVLEFVMWIQELLMVVGIFVKFDFQCGFDYGIFVLMVVMYLKVDVFLFEVLLNVFYDLMVYVEIGCVLVLF